MQLQSENKKKHIIDRPCLYFLQQVTYYLSMHEFLLCYGFYVKPNSSRKEKIRIWLSVIAHPLRNKSFKKSTFLSSNNAVFRKIHTLFHTYKMAYLVRIMGKDYCKCRGTKIFKGKIIDKIIIKFRKLQSCQCLFKLQFLGTVIRYLECFLFPVALVPRMALNWVLVL